MLQGRRIVEGDKRCCRRRELGKDRSQEAHPMQLNPTPPCACVRPRSHWRPAGASSEGCFVWSVPSAMRSARWQSRPDDNEFVQAMSRQRHYFNRKPRLPERNHQLTVNCCRRQARALVAARDARSKGIACRRPHYCAPVHACLHRR